MQRRLLLIGLVGCLSLAWFSELRGQATPAAKPRNDTGVGDTLDNPPPFANLSPAFKSKTIEAAMRKVGDWELERARPYFSQDWTFAALYAGFMAAAKTLPEPRYEDALMQVGNKFEWKLGPRLSHADDQAVGQTYLDLYRDYHQARMMEPTKEQFDTLMKTPDDPAKPIWW